MERLPKKKKHLGTFFGSHASLKDGQHLSYGSFRETDNNSNTFGLRFTHGKGNNQAPYKVETRILIEKR